MNEDTASKVALDAISILNRIAKAMPELEIHLVVNILLDRMKVIVDAELNL
tara:strand:- start:583 stop:735 length:153 start_codon:yes stop_codon:yes gene_type:complete